MNIKVRILSININNIKNLKNGAIEFNSNKKIDKNEFIFDKSDVIGIYGPNGSSKTAIVNSFRILKDIIVSSDLKDRNTMLDHFNVDEVFDLINKEENEAKLELTYFVESNINKFIVIYETILGKDEINKKAFIKKEKISYKVFNESLNKFENKAVLIDVNLTENNFNEFIKPAKFIDDLKRHDKNILSVLQRLLGASSVNNSSFIFNETFFKVLETSENLLNVSLVLRKIKEHARHLMHVYDNKEISEIAANDAIPLFIKNEHDGKINTLVGTFSLFKESLNESIYKKDIFNYFKEIDFVINKIIPDMHVEVIDLGNIILNDGKDGFKSDVVSIRNGVRIPLRLESDGIKKIISLISSLVDIFNNPYSILVVDEFDSGIFEYLLGELLKIIKNDGKGQFLFTSHNLRALETIKDSIIFTSLNNDNRFISYPRISKTDNLRNHYLRDLFLGSNEKFSSDIDSYEISDAFKRAGELLNDK